MVIHQVKIMIFNQIDDRLGLQQRMILPQSMMTEWYWSGTLYAFARVCNLRCALDAQYETRIVANLINKECKELFPISWEELRNT